MTIDVTIATRELSPFEQLVLGLLCEGKSNAAIARGTSHTEKVVENTYLNLLPNMLIICDNFGIYLQHMLKKRYKLTKIYPKWG
jgi:hypothetical protein